MNKVLTLTAVALLATSGLAIAQDAVIVEVPQRARDYVIAHPADPVGSKANCPVAMSFRGTSSFVQFLKVLVTATSMLMAGR